MESKKKKITKKVEKPSVPMWKTRRIRLEKDVVTELHLAGFARIESECVYDLSLSFEKGSKDGLLLGHKGRVEYHAINQPIYIYSRQVGYIVLEEFN